MRPAEVEPVQVDLVPEDRRTHCRVRVDDTLYLVGVGAGRGGEGGTRR